jgi:hypothetical protein
VLLCVRMCLCVCVCVVVCARAWRAYGWVHVACVRARVYDLVSYPNLRTESAGGGGGGGAAAAAAAAATTTAAAAAAAQPSRFQSKFWKISVP